MVTCSASDWPDERIREILAPYGCVPTSDQCIALRIYLDLLLKWNEQISLTTVVDRIDILRFHVGESAFAVPTVPLRDGRLADVGTGAGFPGAVIGLFAPALDVTLIESNVKKSAFLFELQRALNLRNLCVIRSRFEELERIERYDFITSRAVGSRENLLRWSSSMLSRSGQVVLWLGDEDADLVAKNSRWSWRKREKLPNSRNRVLLIGKSIESKM